LAGGAAVKEQRRGGDRLEVEGEPDRCTPPVSERRKERREVGRAQGDGPEGERPAG
jgi:hypothetical protein